MAAVTRVSLLWQGTFSNLNRAGTPHGELCLVCMATRLSSKSDERKPGLGKWKRRGKGKQERKRLY